MPHRFWEIEHIPSPIEKTICHKQMVFSCPGPLQKSSHKKEQRLCLLPIFNCLLPIIAGGALPRPLLAKSPACFRTFSAGCPEAAVSCEAGYPSFCVPA